jgi:hypothetical protein
MTFLFLFSLICFLCSFNLGALEWHGTLNPSLPQKACTPATPVNSNRGRKAGRLGALQARFCGWF